MYIPKQFEEPRVDAMHELIRDRPLATLITSTSGKHGSGASTSTDGSVGKGAGVFSKWVEGFDSKSGYDTKQNAQILGTLSAGLNWRSDQNAVGKLAALIGSPAVSGVANGGVRGSSDASLTRALAAGEQYMKDTNGQEKFDLMRKGSTAENYEHADAGSRSGLAGVRANLDIAEGWQQKSDIARARSASYEQIASEMRSSGASVGSRFEQMMVEWAARDKGIEPAKWDSMSAVERDRLGGEFSNHLLQNHPELLHRSGIPQPDPGAPGELHNTASADPIYSPGQVLKQHEENKNIVTGKQQTDGLTPGRMPSDTVTATARGLQETARDRIDDIETGVAAQGKNIQQAVDNKTLTSQGLLLDASAGAATQILDVDTPMGNPGSLLQGTLNKLGIGAAPQKEQEANMPPLPSIEAPNMAPPGWHTSGVTGRY